MHTRDTGDGVAVVRAQRGAAGEVPTSWGNAEQLGAEPLVGMWAVKTILVVVEDRTCGQ